MINHSKARAYTNIALIKYWGKRDESLILPMNSSLSMTLDRYFTETEVSVDPILSNDQILIDQNTIDVISHHNLVRFLNLIREMSGNPYFAKVESINRVPTAAGFASSASGYAALALAASSAYGLKLTPKELSILARRGSGSASRSIFGGFVLWHRGQLINGEDSYSESLIDEVYEWPIEVISAVVSTDKKSISSRMGMKQTVETSPLYKGWLESVDSDIMRAIHAIKAKDFTSLGEVVEHNALKMHATMMSAWPSVIYFTSGTLEIINLVQRMRQEGIEAYFTIDAGPNVKILCQKSDTGKVKNALIQLSAVQSVEICSLGKGASLIE
ncbi:MAG: diphosphomevalonate decarboxylase [Clostridiales bacterium 38-18]|nr:MAG: diphosphomevalonate decarboxylase [Clostridiales bacterium 38-18]